ncbi:MAG: L,D-transpeptidase family protein [Prevotella sp.]
MHVKENLSSGSIDVDLIHQEIGALTDRERLRFTSDKYAAHFYRSRNRLLWVDWYGVKPQADTLLSRLERVGEHGLKSAFFLKDTIGADMSRLCAFRSNGMEEPNINQVIARLEYHLTKSFLRYYVGQRYGFIQPWHVFNRLDALKEDTVRHEVISYRQLFDVPLEHADSVSMDALLERLLMYGGITSMLDSCETKSPLYKTMREQLADRSLDRTRRQALLCNMERLRWRNLLPDELLSKKQVVVNIAALQLYAYSEDSVMKMKIACGSLKNKTPMLNSHFKYIQLNPTWNIPYSIIKNEVALRARDSAYFARNNYYIVNKESHVIEDVRNISSRMLESGRYSVIQKGGEGNSLGRVIFRFDNNFSVYLHDTSNRQVFDRSHRTVSHGCVRVQNPFGLLTYLVGEKDEWTMDKIRITLGLPPVSARGQRYVEELADEAADVTLVPYLKIDSKVPLFITYFTVYPEEGGRLEYFNDIYEYDKIMMEHLKPCCVF